MFIKSNFKCWKDFSRFKDVAENQQKYTVNDFKWYSDDSD